METNKSNQEDSNQVIQDQEQGGSQVRSYECIFCKRGFSNAQALGGHMNIHRKHKAKLKYSTSNEPHQHQQSLHMISKNIESKSSEDTIKWPWILDKESDTSKNTNIHVGKIQQLSLFVDKPTSTKDQDQHHHQEQEHEEQQPSKLHGIDLELRLGPEPQDSWPATGTKRFF